MIPFALPGRDVRAQGVWGKQIQICLCLAQNIVFRVTIKPCRSHQANAHNAEVASRAGYA